ncbi:hypothetical protein BST61_g1650 [Cercospora zeina]
MRMVTLVLAISRHGSIAERCQIRPPNAADSTGSFESMSSSTAVSIAIIGAGLIGPRHAQSAVANEHATLHCFVDPRPEAISTAEAFHVPLFTSIKHMLLEYGKPDGAIICTPNHTHVALSQELLEAGVNVLVEKPVSTEISNGRQLLETARRTGRHLLAGHHRRFSSYVVSAKRALSEGIIGKPIAVSGLWVLRKPASYFEPPTEWRAVPGKGGPIHINLRRVFPSGHTTWKKEQPSFFDSRQGWWEHSSWRTIVLPAHNFESGTGENPIIPQACKDFYRVFGTEGTLSVGDMKVSKYDSGAAKCWAHHVRESVMPVEPCVPFDEQMKNFVDVMRGLTEPKCTGEDGLKALIACDAVKKSIESGLPVDIAVGSRMCLVSL